MTRVTTTLLVFLVLSNGAITVMEGSGLSDDIGVTLAPGVSDEVGELTAQAKDGFSASEGIGDTLFALFAAAFTLVSIFVQSLWALPSMLLNVGFPVWIVVPLTTPLYLIATLEVLYAATGRRMV